MVNREWMNGVDDFGALKIAEGILDRIGFDVSPEDKASEAMRMAIFIVTKANDSEVDNIISGFEDQFNG